MMNENSAEVPVGHVDRPESIETVIDALHDLHASDGYRFSVNSWEGKQSLDTGDFGARYVFVMRAEDADVQLRPGDAVRGPGETDAYERRPDGAGTVKTALSEEVWPGDTLVVKESDDPLGVSGEGLYFSVQTEETEYPAPRLSMLRNLGSEPGGCASYDDAFRREALPPYSVDEGENERGENRVNQHTLDMRIDREPGPIKHYHGPVSVGPGEYVNHSEIALVLPRHVYDRPPFEYDGRDRTDDGWVKMYRNPVTDPSDTVTMPLTPGSIHVTPATEETVFGHCFENAFAMLVAVPGFVAPLNYVDEPE